MGIRVVNLRGDSPCQAEPGEEVVVVDRTTKLGNPFHMKEHSMAERESVIKRYRGHLYADIANKGPMSKELDRIVSMLDSGKNVALACHCAPLPCHADQIKKAAEELLAKRFRIRGRFHKDGTLPQRESTIFVFGSNAAGRHGKGAALIAAKQYGAEPGNGSGLMGRSFAIPTKDEMIQTMPLWEVDFYIGHFCAFAKLNPDKNFFVTRVGAGLAGNTDESMAALFLKYAKMVGHDLANCSFAEEWKIYLTK